MSEQAIEVFDVDEAEEWIQALPGGDRAVILPNHVLRRVRDGDLIVVDTQAENPCGKLGSKGRVLGTVLHAWRAAIERCDG